MRSLAHTRAASCDSILAMSIADSLPTDLASAHALIIAQREALSAAQARRDRGGERGEVRALLIEKLKYTIAKLRHERFGQSSERGALLDQLELQLADLEEDARKPRRRRSWRQRARRSRCRRSSGASRRAVRCPSICRASASSIRRPRPARAAAARRCARSART